MTIETPRELLALVYAFLCDVDAAKIASKISKNFQLADEEIIAASAGKSLIGIYTKSLKKKRKSEADITEIILPLQGHVTQEPVANGISLVPTETGSVPQKESKKSKKRKRDIADEGEISATIAGELTETTTPATTPSKPGAIDVKSPLDVDTPNGQADSHKNGKKGTPFQRVKAEDVTYLDDRLKDNSFFTKVDDYGMKAWKDLSVTRGKGFRAEKQKKKKGSYRGGIIDTTASSSIKFKYSDDEE